MANDLADAIAERDLANIPPTADPANWMILLTPGERDALVAEVRRLRADVAVLEQVCRDQRERVPAKTRDPESGIYVGGLSCEHPNVTCDRDRCRSCGATGDDL